MRRFWTDVTVDAARVVLLDARPVRTPGRAPLALPSDTLAQAVAGEWQAVGDTVDPRAMPLTGLANAAIDRVAPDPAAFVADLARYGDTDLLYYRAASPAELEMRQAEAWDPLLDWARARYDVHFTIGAGVMHLAQPAATLVRLREALTARAPFALVALQPIVTITGTLVGTLALAEAAIPPDTLWAAAHVDEDWQIAQWGTDDLAAANRVRRRQDFDAAVTFLRLAA